MKRLLLIPFICLALVALSQDDPCQDLNIDLAIDPLVPGYLLVFVENNSTELFDYPGWRIFDEMDNLIGEEVVNFFGIGQESIHQVAVETNFEIDVEYEFYLELWTGFYDTLACSFSINAIPFPSMDCGAFAHSMGASSPGELDGETVNWSISDLDENLIESGIWNTVENAWFLDSLCLPTGCYKLNLMAAGPMNTNLVSSLNAWVWDTSNATVLSAESPNAELIFGIYSVDCIVDDIPSFESETTLWEFYPNPVQSEITILTLDEGMQYLEIYDLTGKILIAETFLKSETLSLEDLSSGLYVIRLNGESSRRFVKVE